MAYFVFISNFLYLFYMKKQEYIERYGIDAWEKFKEYQKEYYKANKEKICKRVKNYKDSHKTECTNWYKEYRKTPKGRAHYLAMGYNAKDLKYRGIKGEMTSDFILKNIFTSKCVYCGESDWSKLGCDRIDNSQIHTPNNVVCCCYNCNTKRQTTPFYDFLIKSPNYYPLVKR